MKTPVRSRNIGVQKSLSFGFICDQLYIYIFICLYLSFLKEQTWFLYLNLKVVSQRLMYVSLEVVVVTSAW